MELPEHGEETTAGQRLRTTYPPEKSKIDHGDVAVAEAANLVVIPAATGQSAARFKEIPHVAQCWMQGPSEMMAAEATGVLAAAGTGVLAWSVIARRRWAQFVVKNKDKTDVNDKDKSCDSFLFELF
ncbi:enterotoxin/cell-wall binding protein [Striga asiatica]|uniref:Enterotoxin/cell-wall binding protein n=1 Tax=Striga asiatica TaxID=4170 RepID=A0A5A7PWW2_STRAF|nr:enterotoxin/cell-wall binding protein [Striga asiatica]